MLTEEAHHLFVGETGVQRIVQRTAELMKEAPGEDVREVGGIPLDIIQRYINEWYSSSPASMGRKATPKRPSPPATNATLVRTAARSR